MDEFSLIVLEDTLQLANEVLPSELISGCVSRIRDYVRAISADRTDHRSAQDLREVLKQLSDVAHSYKRFLVETRLQSIARQFDVPDVA
jgi:hypothetical protein